jgi:flavin-dependent dehydrogenase
MTKVSVVGAGPAGLIFAYALLREGYDVTVYSDRTPDQWLNYSAPTGTAYLYASTIAIEQELGMDYWYPESHKGDGIFLDFKPTVRGEARLEMRGLFPGGMTPGGGGAAIDQRMRVHRWLEDLEARGGRLVIESVTPERLDQIALASDLTVLAAGKADLANIIGRDPARSVYDRPQRNLSMVIVENVKGWGDRVDFTPVKFNFFGDIGEYFWVPYTHKTAGATWCALFEAKPGGAMDRFGDCTSAGQAVDIAKAVIADIGDFEWEGVKDMQAVEDDPYCWLKGRFPPTVRNAFGRLPSGGLVMPIGDTAITFDPIGGQGGNNASRSAKFAADAVIALGDGPFDEAWMTAVNSAYWEAHGKPAYTFNNILLEPLTEAGGTILMESVNNRGFADSFFAGNFPTPEKFFPGMVDAAAARALISAAHAAAAA